MCIHCVDLYMWCHLLIRQEIVIWTKKKTGAPVLRINSINEATGILQKLSTFVVGLFEGFEVC